MVFCLQTRKPKNRNRTPTSGYKILFLEEMGTGEQEAELGRGAEVGAKIRGGGTNTQTHMLFDPQFHLQELIPQTNLQGPK